uniref:Ubiquitin-conjugating enzyme E2 J1 n=1 Tax=Cacopsylla melanoneura TaxID=428564 RepID=A0A8D8T326_9HEMI
MNLKENTISKVLPNGRFEINTKICLSISGHHPETWQPSWSIRTALLALIAFMPTPGSGTAGSLDYTPEERKVLARKSQQWSCSLCGKPQLKDASEINNAPKPEDEEQTQSSTETENIVRDSFTDDSQPINSPEVSSNSGIASTLCIGVLIVAIMAIIFRRIYLM